MNQTEVETADANGIVRNAAGEPFVFQPNRRSEGGKKAAETRRRNREAQAKQEPSVDASALRVMIQRVFEKREEVAEAQDTLACMETELDMLINRITYSKP